VQVQTVAPQIAETMRRYLQTVAVFQAPSSVDVAENSLRKFADWMITNAGLASVISGRRDDIEDFKVWLANKPRPQGGKISPETQRQRHDCLQTINQMNQTRHPIRTGGIS
jgi:hypothetical protein